MGAGKNKSHRKKRISKHVLQAEERRKILESEVADDDPKTTTSSDRVVVTSNDENDDDDDDDGDARVNKKRPAIVDGKEKKQNKKKEKNDGKIKDPKEGASYLSLWKHDRLGSWKFNKNTQSWLYRHMYDSNRVSKISFALLIEYATEGGEGTRRRLIEDAKRRARRYKDWEGGRGEGKGGGGEESQRGSNDDDVISSSEKEAGGSSSSSSAVSVAATEDKAWNTMDEHDKRKEYKRARKVLDVLKGPSI
jgi:hypothetical protein